MLSTENSSIWTVFMPGRIGGFLYFKVSVPNTATKLTWKSKNENFRSSHYYSRGLFHERYLIDKFLVVIFDF